MGALAGKVVLVTGAAKRIGRAIALASAEGGADLVVHYNRSAAEANEVVEAIHGMGRRSVAIRADLQRAAEVRALVTTALEEMGRIDALVNNAAVFPRTPFAEMTEKEWDRTLATNLKAPALLAQAVAPHMQERGSGKIVNLADIAAERAWPNYLPYCVSKAGVVTMTRVLARALAPAIQVNAVAPGAILFPNDWDEARRAQLLARIPMQRAGDPGDIARTVLFLLEGPDYITGAVIPVDGGWLLSG
jgi:NAD(P)-dependent dehydrogenase (short-subunit alcohol dehydrogenase family)